MPIRCLRQCALVDIKLFGLVQPKFPVISWYMQFSTESYQIPSVEIALVMLLMASLLLVARRHFHLAKVQCQQRTEPACRFLYARYRLK